MDAIVHAAATGSGCVILLMMASLLAVLLFAAVPSMKTFGMKFFAESTWRPNALEKVGISSADFFCRRWSSSSLWRRS